MKENWEIDFEWDENKAAINAAKHGVTFERAATAFDDRYARKIPDPDHSGDEDRFVLIGLDTAADVLVVCHCYRRGGVIRLISARRATRNEERGYWRWRS